MPTGASRKPLLVVSEDDERTVDDILRKKGIGPCDRLVVVNPGASCPSRRWKTERYREVVRRLLQDGFRVAVIGVGAEAEIAAEVLRGLEVRALNLTGILSVGETAALIKRAHLLISNDTGPVHMASALGTAVVVIFGRKDPGLSPVVWGPIGENTIVLHAYNCPYHELAQEHRAICEMDEEVMRKVLGSDVSLSACMMDGHRGCSFVVSNYKPAVAA